ncbi:helix-turn-helix domain-containing protein [Streptomyces sp. NPDC091287]|uniref:helix-turn-helix domain-containing protein n=1 Tax=Streptomyces sp. NPDC091287 TaxID=3365988 RepID=UPI00382D875F
MHHEPMSPERVLAKRRAIGLRVRAAREYANLTLEAVWIRSGIRITTISDIEQGHRAALIDTLIKIADAIGVPLEGFVREDSEDSEE